MHTHYGALGQDSKGGGDVLFAPPLPERVSEEDCHRNYRSCTTGSTEARALDAARGSDNIVVLSALSDRGGSACCRQEAVGPVPLRGFHGTLHILRELFLSWFESIPASQTKVPSNQRMF